MSQDANPLAALAGLQMPETVADMRALLDGFAGLLNGELPEVGAFEPGIAVGDRCTTDVIVPRGAGPHPVLVYLHGGGWICGSPTTHNRLAHRFAEAGFLVFNVDYRLAPEHPFPIPLEDCIHAIRWARREAPRWGGDPGRLAVGGDSAGGNLSAAACAALAGDDDQPRCALLIYGVFDFATIGAPGPATASLPGLDEAAGRKLVSLMVDSYLGEAPSAAVLADPRVSPLHAADRLPPSHVVVGAMDPLAAQAEALVEALARAGVEHEHFVDEGMPHGYAQMEFLAPALPAVGRMIAFLRKHLE